MAKRRHNGSKSYYEHKYREFGDQVLRADFMQSQMRFRGAKIMVTAQAISPVETGEYKRSFRIESGVRQTGRTRRAYSRVTNVSSHAMAVEFGWGGTPRYRVLGRALGVIPGDQKAGA